jgi:hypothetical protein
MDEIVWLKHITGALVIFIVDGRWASFTIADSLVVIGEFSLKFIVVTGLWKAVVETGRQRNNRKMKGLILESQPERMMVGFQDRVNGLMLSGDITNDMTMILDLFTHT